MTVLPTLTRLGVTLPGDIDVTRIASRWFDAFAAQIQSRTPETVLVLLTDDALVRDMLALTWDFRTLEGTPKIRAFLTERVPKVAFTPGSFMLLNAVRVDQPALDMMFIQAFFGFETNVGHVTGIFRLVPTAAGASITWKAFTVYTRLDSLKGHPEKIGALRDHAPNHGSWAEQRRREVAYADRNPTVLVVGAGQSGLGIAARLKALGIDALVIEKNPRVGDNWRNRYEALCLHDPVYYDHMPYLPFPSTWPVYTPAMKLADWLEFYAHSLELNVWTSSVVTYASQSPKTLQWKVIVKRGEDTREFVVNHLVFAVGVGGGQAKLPTIPGMDAFQGETVHSSQYRRADDYTGKKVVVVGSGTSAHDICSDLSLHGIDVTMVQRGPTYVMSLKQGMSRLMSALYSETSPPTEISDTIGASVPIPLLEVMYPYTVREIAEADKDMLEGLRKRGFKLTFGENDSGLLLIALKRLGGYYVDVGASGMIIDGKIKLKNDSKISKISLSGLVFEDGSTLDADAIVYATGYGDTRSVIRSICGDAVADQTSRIWGLNKEGEINGAWRDSGVPNMWIMMGNLQWCRFHSKHLALQIKAIEEGLFGERYALVER